MGCDWRLDSNSVEDHCGICNGDGSGCRLVNETYIDSGQGNFKVFFYYSWVDSFGVKWINIQLLVRLLTLLISCMQNRNEPSTCNYNAKYANREIRPSYCICVFHILKKIFCRICRVNGNQM